MSKNGEIAKLPTITITWDAEAQTVTPVFDNFRTWISWFTSWRWPWKRPNGTGIWS